MKRGLAATWLAILCILASAASIARAGDLPTLKRGSSVGEGLPFKAYATMSPTVHLFGDVVTAELAVVADTRWVNPSRLRVHADFAPYSPVSQPSIVRIATGRFEQVTWTWRIRCIDSPCVPRVPDSDRYHVFHFSPARVEYVDAAGTRRYGLDAFWPPIEVVSSVSPGVQRFLQLTNHIAWRYRLAPVAAANYRVSPTVLFWLAIGLAVLFAAGAAYAAGRWYLVLRPRGAAVERTTESSLERALMVLRYAHEAGDETLQRKAFERIADELGTSRADELTRVARELAWSPRTPEDAEVERFTSAARDATPTDDA